jgi:hypothetical protein
VPTFVSTNEPPAPKAGPGKVSAAKASENWTRITITETMTNKVILPKVVLRLIFPSAAETQFSKTPIKKSKKRYVYGNEFDLTLMLQIKLLQRCFPTPTQYNQLAKFNHSLRVRSKVCWLKIG